MKQPVAVLSRLLEGLLLGDGCLMYEQDRKRKPRWSYHTMSKQLADDVQLLALLTGKRGRISQRKGTHLYEVGICDKSWASIDDAKHGVVEYNDTAFCVTVQNHAIYVRTNGVAAFTGNSNYREMLITLPSQETKFDPALVKIERSRQSTTQGSFTIAYDGKKVGKFGDTITLQDGKYQGKGDAEIVEIMRRRFNGSEELRIKPMHSGYKSSHFDQPNILAHLRVDDRVDADGFIFARGAIGLGAIWQKAGF